MELSFSINPFLAIALFVTYAAVRVVIGEGRGIASKRRRTRI